MTHATPELNSQRAIELLGAISSDQDEKMVALLDSGASLEGSELASDMSVMHAAAAANAAKCITRLISRAADPVAEVNQLTSSGITPLHQAATSFAVDAALVLIEHGADVNAKHSPLSSTPLGFAMGRQQDPDTAARERMSLALIAHGATTWLATTPIEAAAKGGFTQKLGELLGASEHDRGALIKLASDAGHADAADLIRGAAARELAATHEMAANKLPRPR